MDPRVLVALSPEPLDLAAVHAHLADAGAGGEVVFTGTVRDHHVGRHVTALEFEAYAEMAVASLAQLAADMLGRWDLRRVALLHRTGRVEVGGVCVVVGVSAPHRVEAFEACRHGIDTLKAEAPIWKREVFEGGEAWVSNHP